MKRFTKPYTWLALVSLLVFTLSGTVKAAPNADANSRYFPQTGHTVTQPFLDYWNTHGALAQQGYPITDDYQEVNSIDGKTYRTQYFERARFEFHPEQVDPNYQVLLGLLGVEAFNAKYPSGLPAGTQTQVVPGGGSQFFASTGHTVTGLFLDYWNNHGGLAQQGYPISEPYMETNDADGKQYVTQYFQRARFEFHPEQADPNYKVLLGLVGDEIYQMKHSGGMATPTQPTPHNQPTNTPTNTPVPPGQPTNTPTSTPTKTSTAVPAPPTNTPTNTPTSTPVPHTAATTQVVNVQSIPAGTNGSVTANCPAGSLVVGGGWGLESNHLNLQIYNSSMSGFGWLVSAHNYDSSAQLLFGYAICLSGVDATVTQQPAQQQVPAGGSVQLVASCPGGMVTGGGFADALVMSLYNTAPNGNGWSAAATNNASYSQLLISYALCLSGVNATSQFSVQGATVAAGALGSVTASCPSGSIVTGGGFAGNNGLIVYHSGMTGDGQGWYVGAKNITANSILLNAYAMCTTFH